jgi:hypothetical protein
VKIQIGTVVFSMKSEYGFPMTVNQLMRETEALSFEEKGQLAAYLVQMRNRKDPEYLAEMQARIEEKDSSRWLNPDEFEIRLGSE